MFSKSIRWRIQAWHGFLLTCLVAGLVVGFYGYEYRQRFERIDAQLHELAVPLLPKLIPPGVRGPGRRPAELPRQGLPPDDFGPPGMPRRPPPGGEGLVDPRNPEPLEAPPSERRGEGQFEDQQHALGLLKGGEFYYIAWSPERTVTSKSAAAPANIPRPGMSVPTGLRTRGEFRELVEQVPNGYCIVIGTSTARTQLELGRLALWLGLVGVGVVVLGLAGGWRLASRAIRPIREISAAADRIAGGNLSNRINVSETESELGQLAVVLNRTFERLEKAFEQQVRFTADASHELRTPISVILTQVQLAASRERSADYYRNTLAACERAAERMGSLVNSLLELARMDSGEFELAREECDLARVAREALELVTPLAQQRRATLKESIEPMVICGDAQRLGQVCINLLTNAIQHNPEGTEISLELKRNGAEAILRVADNGVGIPAEAMPHLFERFFRVDQSRSGSKGNSGLGLAISKAIVEAHGGSIRAERRAEGGTEFIIELPLSGNR